MTVPQELVLAFILVFCVLTSVGVVMLILNSRRWTGPALDVRMEQVEADTQSMRSSIARIDRDLTAWHRMSNDTNAEIMRELRDIRDSLIKEVSVKRLVDATQGEVQDLKQMIRDLPCVGKSEGSDLGITTCPRCNETFQMGRNHACPAGTEPT